MTVRFDLPDKVGERVYGQIYSLAVEPGELVEFVTTSGDSALADKFAVSTLRNRHVTDAQEVIKFLQEKDGYGV